MIYLSGERSLWGFESAIAFFVGRRAIAFFVGRSAIAFYLQNADPIF
ncbi:MAG: hypothetical protein JGK21_27390 [Microcoleus sp. PH2017_22_RUC_O_B]|nr:MULTISPECIES: hypothetical protein [unclassified Microcoleus]MCC3531686.1 hypothetical protein [Microcoleus sp. PH2017_21_RUC_O_A]MCC3544009.1 hypothetical protein [Microcoleus sp. PH2017_22_RUC_O_B]